MKAIAGTEAEVIIVDNASTDRSIEFLQPLFPSFQFIQNKINTGFAKANNQAMHLASGEYILFLNPDTLVPEDCFTTCISFMENHADAGAIGVRMINGRNEFLKESKRGFPTPMVSFGKMTGISSARYYMSHLHENETNKVDILSGAFMFVRKKVLDITGGFDERFFMYAEDIDLSYRITQAGFNNYYFPEITIIHYKGESTKKDIKYIKQFYLAMSQFVKKYYGRGAYSFLLDTAIWIRAGIHALIKK
jgi:N-acetylglucosaminyl-diphospho-decaprenol L-rhamnosyltransferase